MPPTGRLRAIPWALAVGMAVAARAQEPRFYEREDDDMVLNQRPVFPDDPAHANVPEGWPAAPQFGAYPAPAFAAPGAVAPYYQQPPNAMQPALLQYSAGIAPQQPFYTGPYPNGLAPAVPMDAQPAQPAAQPRFRAVSDKSDDADENGEDGSSSQESEEAGDRDQEVASKKKHKGKKHSLKAKSDDEHEAAGALIEVTEKTSKKPAAKADVKAKPVEMKPIKPVEMVTVIPEKPVSLLEDTAKQQMGSMVSVGGEEADEEAAENVEKDPLDDPLEEVKHDIIENSNKIKAETSWVAQVETVIQKYQKKAANVRTDIEVIRAKIKDLLIKKRQIQNLKLQKQLEQKLADATADMGTLEKALDHVQEKQKNFVSTKNHLEDTIGSLKSALGTLKGETPEEAAEGSAAPNGDSAEAPEEAQQDKAQIAQALLETSNKRHARLRSRIGL